MMIQRAIPLGAVFALVAQAAFGQSQPGAPADQAGGARRARYQIQVMEGVLERAVQHGAQVIGAQLRTYAPEMMLFTGPARARGFRLDGYGMFFSVDVPAVRRSMSWSFRTLSQQSVDLSRALQSLKRHVQSTPAGRARAELEQALKLVELQVGPAPVPPPSAPTSGPTSVAATSAAPADQGAPAGPDIVRDVEGPIADPGEEYESQVKLALVDAMLDYGHTLDIGPDEWLTVAARDNEETLLGGDLAETVTIVFRIKGRDLSAFRAGSVSRDETRKHVEVTER
jgi:hypothetical protein